MTNEPPRSEQPGVEAEFQDFKVQAEDKLDKPAPAADGRTPTKGNSGSTCAAATSCRSSTITATSRPSAWPHVRLRLAHADAPTPANPPANGSSWKPPSSATE